jgi:hypothetical protein
MLQQHEDSHGDQAAIGFSAGQKIGEHKRDHLFPGQLVIAPPCVQEVANDRIFRSRGDRLLDDAVHQRAEIAQGGIVSAENLRIDGGFEKAERRVGPVHEETLLLRRK